jgi:hypothetical protein
MLRLVKSVPGWTSDWKQQNIIVRGLPVLSDISSAQIFGRSILQNSSLQQDGYFKNPNLRALNRHPLWLRVARMLPYPFLHGPEGLEATGQPQIPWTNSVLAGSRATIFVSVFLKKDARQCCPRGWLQILGGRW